jgi:hypothetical protein
VRDQRRVVLGEQCSIGGEEAQQVRHLLQVGGHIRVIASEVHVVELNVHNILYTISARSERTGAGRAWRLLGVAGFGRRKTGAEQRE